MLVGLLEKQHWSWHVLRKSWFQCSGQKLLRGKKGNLASLITNRIRLLCKCFAELEITKNTASNSAAKTGSTDSQIGHGMEGTWQSGCDGLNIKKVESLPTFKAQCRYHTTTTSRQGSNVRQNMFLGDQFYFGSTNTHKHSHFVASDVLHVNGDVHNGVETQRRLKAALRDGHCILTFCSLHLQSSQITLKNRYLPQKKKNIWFSIMALWDS